MSRYIDADKLIAEIERLVKVNKELKPSRFTEGIAAGYGDVLSAITSLQQECIYGRTLEEREKYCKFCSAVCEVRVEQEQPEVDLEKEIDRVFFQQDCGSERLYYNEIANIARHFCELGFNTKKEERK